MNQRIARDSKRDLRQARIGGSIISAVLISLGVWSMVSRTYAGHTSKLGGANIFLSGDPAIAAGTMLVALGLFPLASWFRSGGAAGWWASICPVAFVVLLLVVVRG